MRIENVITFIVGVLLFLAMRPYFTWGISGSYAQLLFVFPLAILFCINSKITRQNVFYFFVFMLTLLFASISQNRNIMGMLSLIVLAGVPFVSRGYMIKVYDKYKMIYLIVVGLSICMWSFVQMGMGFGGVVISPLNTVKTYDYMAYPFLVIPNYMGIDSYFQSLRFCGPFDEPGVVGTIAGLMLYIDDFNLKDKRNIVILLSGLLSMSLFFYLLSIVFAVYYLFTKQIKIKYRIFVVLFVILLIVFSKQSPVLNLLIWDRLEYDKTEGAISGDNRASEELKVYFDSIQGTSEFWWGIDNKSRLSEFSDSAGYRNAVLSNGAIVCIMYLLFFILFAISSIKSIWYIIIFISLLLMTLYQRPGLFSVNYIYLFSMYIIMHSKYEIQSMKYKKLIR